RIQQAKQADAGEYPDQLQVRNLDDRAIGPSGVLQRAWPVELPPETEVEQGETEAVRCAEQQEGIHVHGTSSAAGMKASSSLSRSCGTFCGGPQVRRGDSHMRMVARNTISPAASNTSTRTGHSWPSPISPAASVGVATARMVPRAFFRYSTLMPRGIQRIDGGILTSVVSPPMNSARLHRAMACTVPRWLLTRRRWRRVASPRPGASDTIRGPMLEK